MYHTTYTLLLLLKQNNKFLMLLPQLLDLLLGRGRVALYRRAELKTLVDLHGNEVKKSFLILRARNHSIDQEHLLPTFLVPSLN